jgi:hypothetical protein
MKSHAKTICRDVYIKYCVKFTPAIVLPPAQDIHRRREASVGISLDPHVDIMERSVSNGAHLPETSIPKVPEDQVHTLPILPRGEGSRLDVLPVHDTSTDKLEEGTVSVSGEIVHLPALGIYVATGDDALGDSNAKPKSDGKTTRAAEPQESGAKERAQVNRPAPSVFTTKDGKRDTAQGQEVKDLYRRDISGQLGPRADTQAAPADLEAEALREQSGSAVDQISNVASDNTILHPAPGIYRRATGKDIKEAGKVVAPPKHTVPVTGGVALKPATVVYEEEPEMLEGRSG